jgi:citrate lyase beta subunit
MELHRSLLFVPGSDPDRIETAASSTADVVVVDLEDGVSDAHKDIARENAIDSLTEWDTEKPLGIRINGIDTPRGIDDIRHVLDAGREPAFLAVPDVHGRSDVRIVAETLDGTDIQLLPLIETPSAVFRVEDIAHATPRIYGLLFAAIDFQMNMGMDVLGDADLSLPQYLVSMAASSAGVPAFDKPLLVDGDEELAAEISRARGLGYDGKLAVTVEQAAAINDGFLPSEEELLEARRVVEAFDASDRGLVEIDGVFVDKPAVEQLRNRIELAETAAEEGG